MTIRQLALGAALILSVSPATWAGTLHVPAQYPTIQAAVDAAVPGDKIRVGSGNFAPFTVTTDDLSIRAADEDANPVIVIPGFGQMGQVGITIDADRVTVEGLSVTGFGAGLAPFSVGFRVTGDDNTLRGNHAVPFLGTGFEALSCNRTVFDGNSVAPLFGGGTGFKAVGCADEVYRKNSMDGGNTGFQQTGCTNQTYTQNATDGCPVGFQCTLQGGPTTGGIYRENIAVDGDYLFLGLSNASLRNNTATNGFAGFWLSASNGNDLRDNLAADAYIGSGFILDQGSDLNDLRGNQSIGNAGFGYRVEDMLGNTFVDNEADGNAMGPANQPGIVD